jgi:hypothetical protein
VGIAIGLFIMSVGAASARQAQGTAAPSAAETRERNLKAYIELLRSDVRTQKIAVITEVMGFTEAEDKAFWPVYRQYEVDLSRINDDRLKLIERYAQVYTKLTDAEASDLVTKTLDLEARRTALKQQFYNKLKGVMSAITAARVLQIEHQIQLLLDLQIAASLPIAQ